MNNNLPEKQPPEKTDWLLFPQEISRDDIEKEIKKTPIAIQKILNYYLLTDFESKYEEIHLFLKHFNENKKIPIAKINNPVIYKIIKTARSIQRQIHKLMGLLRFREIEGGYLYASFTSDFNIIGPLSLHFSRRFPEEKLIIHDTKRRKALFVEKGKLYEVVSLNTLPSDTDEESFFRQLWQRYHQNISITERENKKLQRQNIPLKFQHWLTEFKGSCALPQLDGNRENI
jgi:probable DNA metabolism protein